MTKSAFEEAQEIIQEVGKEISNLVSEGYTPTHIIIGKALYDYQKSGKFTPQNIRFENFNSEFYKIFDLIPIIDCKNLTRAEVICGKRIGDNF